MCTVAAARSGVFTYDDFRALVRDDQKADLVDSSITSGFYGFQSSAQDIQSITLRGTDPADMLTIDLDNFTHTAPGVVASPEPSTLTLLAFGRVSLLGYAGPRWRRKVATA